MAKFWLEQWDSGTPDALYGDGKVWKGQWDSGTPDARYADGQIWLGQWDFGTPDGRYADGRIWIGQWDSGIPDARYADGQVWRDQWDSGVPDARYDGSDSGAAATALLLLLGVGRSVSSGDGDDEGDTAEVRLDYNHTPNDDTASSGSVPRDRGSSPSIKRRASRDSSWVAELLVGSLMAAAALGAGRFVVDSTSQWSLLWWIGAILTVGGFLGLVPLAIVAAVVGLGIAAGLAIILVILAILRYFITHLY